MKPRDEIDVRGEEWFNDLGEELAIRVISVLNERHDVFANGWYEPILGKKIHIGDNCSTCNTHFGSLRNDIHKSVVYYASELITAQNNTTYEAVMEAIDGLEIDMEATEKQLRALGLPEDETARHILSAKIDCDDRHDTLDDVRQSINKIFGKE